MRFKYLLAVFIAALSGHLESRLSYWPPPGSAGTAALLYCYFVRVFRLFLWLWLRYCAERTLVSAMLCPARVDRCRVTSAQFRRLSTSKLRRRLRAAAVRAAVLVLDGLLPTTRLRRRRPSGVEPVRPKPKLLHVMSSGSVWLEDGRLGQTWLPLSLTGRRGR